MAQTTKQSDNVELGALWKRTGNAGQYLTGVLKLEPIGINKEINIVIFTNKFKTADNQPDLRIYVSKPKSSTNTKTPAPKATQKEQVAPEPEPDNDII